jgi:hypothetical protein
VDVGQFAGVIRVRLLRQHAGRKLADDVLLALGEPVEP